MNNNTIDIFLATYERKSISKTAKELFFSKQNISKSLKALEVELGIELFVRDTDGLEPTEEAHELYNILKYLKANLINIEEFYKIKKNPYSVRIADNNFESITKYFNKALEKYYDESILYSFANEDTQEIYNMLLMDKCDIGIFVIPKILEGEVRKQCKDNNINLELLLETEPCIIVNNNHLLAKFDTVEAKDLRDFKRIDIVRPNEKIWYFNKYLIENDINIDADMKTNGLCNVITSLQLLDYYFITMYSEMDRKQLVDLKMIPFKGTGLEILVFLGYKNKDCYDKVAECFMNLVRKHYRGEEFED